MTRLTSDGRIERAGEAERWQRTCDVCDDALTDDDVHTNDETGGDCHGACCPTCNKAPAACMICEVAGDDVRTVLQLLVELQVESLLPVELAALNRLQRAVGQ